MFGSAAFLRVLSVAGLLGLLCWASTAVAATQDAKLLRALDGGLGEPGDGFGSSISVSGDLALVSSGASTDGHENNGAVYAYAFDATTRRWVFEQRFIADDAQAHTLFGSAVSLSGTRALVAGGLESSAYIFERGSSGQWVQHAKLLPGDPDLSGSWYGWAVSLDGDRAIVGAPHAYRDSRAEGKSGAAYIYERDASGTWVEVEKVWSSEFASDDFGHAVSASGDWAVFGAPAADAFVGAAYVFQRTASGDWIERQKLVPSNPDFGELFGWSVSLSGDRMLIGAASDFGSAYIFERQGDGIWVEVEKLVPSDLEYDHFGQSVSLSGDRALIGATWDDDDGQHAGAVYVYTRDANGIWAQTQKLLASDGTADLLFGSNLSVSGNRSLIGVPRHDGNGRNSGAVYAFELDNDNWTELEILHPGDGPQMKWFGHSVSLSLTGDRALVGASRDGDNGSLTGAAYIFERDESSGRWREVAKLLADDGEMHDWFGSFLGLSGDHALIGAGDRGLGPRAVYAFERDSAGVWRQVGKPLNTEGERLSYEIGKQVSLFADRALVGADQGAYILQREASGDWVQVQKLLGTTLSRALSLSGDRALVEDDYSVLVFEREPSGLWLHVDTLVASDGNAFGDSVSLSGNHALVGGALVDSRAGAVYAFERDLSGNWSEVAKLGASDSAVDKRFGKSVSVLGNRALIGSHDDENAGAVYVFERDVAGNWMELEKLTAKDGAPYDEFGNSVSLSRDWYLIGTPYNDQIGTDAGAAYIFDRAGVFWDGFE